MSNKQASTTLHGLKVTAQAERGGEEEWECGGGVVKRERTSESLERQDGIPEQKYINHTSPAISINP